MSLAKQKKMRNRSGAIAELIFLFTHVLVSGFFAFYTIKEDNTYMVLARRIISTINV
jgi:hypothetical protein